MGVDIIILGLVNYSTVPMIGSHADIEELGCYVSVEDWVLEDT